MRVLLPILRAPAVKKEGQWLQESYFGRKIYYVGVEVLRYRAISEDCSDSVRAQSLPPKSYTKGVSSIKGYPRAKVTYLRR
jgi:hypothetical protein